MSELFAGTETLIDHITGSFAETVPSSVAPSVILESKLSEVISGAVVSVTGIVVHFYFICEYFWSCSV